MLLKVFKYLGRFQESLSISKEIKQLILAGLIDSLYRCLSSPAVNLVETHLIVALIRFGFIIVQEISALCALIHFKVIINY